LARRYPLLLVRQRVDIQCRTSIAPD
jgi:hypothetical protein